MRAPASLGVADVPNMPMPAGRAGGVSRYAWPVVGHAGRRLMVWAGRAGGKRAGGEGALHSSHTNGKHQAPRMASAGLSCLAPPTLTHPRRRWWRWAQQRPAWKPGRRSLQRLRQRSGLTQGSTGRQTQGQLRSRLGQQRQCSRMSCSTAGSLSSSSPHSVLCTPAATAGSSPAHRWRWHPAAPRWSPRRPRACHARTTRLAARNWGPGRGRADG